MKQQSVQRQQSLEMHLVVPAMAASTLVGGPVTPIVGAVGIAAGAGASKITDKAIRTGESVTLNKYNSGKKKKKRR